MRLRTVTGALLAAGLFFGAIPASAAQAHRFSACPSGSYIWASKASNLAIEGEGAGNNVQLQAFGQCFSHINNAVWSFNGHTTWEWQNSIGQCLYSGPVTSYALRLTNCVPGDGYELFDTSFTTGSVPYFWAISQGVTDFRHNGQYWFMTALGNTAGSTIEVTGPHNNNDQLWYISTGQ